MSAVLKQAMRRAWPRPDITAAIYHDFVRDEHAVDGVRQALDQIWTFERDSIVNGWERENRANLLTSFAVDEPAFVIDPATGQRLGYRALAGATNKCQNFNLNPDASLTNISASAGTLERVDDSANLPLSNQFDGNSFHLNNGTGGSVTITVTGQCGNTNAHSIGVLCRFTGTAPTVQLTGGDGAATCNNDYDETKSEGVTPSATTDQWQLVVPDGTEVWFVANQLEEGAFISSWIETAGATGSTAADDATEPLPASCQDGFVWVVHARTAQARNGNHSFSIDNGQDDRIQLNWTSGNTFKLVVEASNTVLFSNLGSTVVAEDQDFKIAILAVDGDYRLCVDGGSVEKNTSSGFPAGLSTKRIGNSAFGADYWNGTIALDYLDPDPSAWTDQDLVDATS